MNILLANPRGFCAGVDRAIEIVERALARFGAPIYVRHEIVHNRYVVDDLRAKGAIFVEDLADVPAGATLVFSAHGVSQAVRAEAEARGLRVFDATCPLVTKVHVEVAQLRARATRSCMIGHAGHLEVEGTMGQRDRAASTWSRRRRRRRDSRSRDPDALAFVTQTTLSVDDARGDHRRAAGAASRRSVGPRKDDICYATQNRQDAVKAHGRRASTSCIVVGSPSSSNSNRLRELAGESRRARVHGRRRRRARARMGCRAALRRRDRRRVGAGSAGARSARALAELGATNVRELAGTVEGVVFPLPRGLGAGAPQPTSTNS